MTRLVIGNSRTAEMVGDLAALTPTERAAGGHAAQRLLWFAQDNDILVLPQAPRPGYLDYVTGLTGATADSLAVVVPPPGAFGTGVLSPDRLTDPRLIGKLTKLLADRPAHGIMAVYKDPSVIELARLLGLEHTVPGHRFSAQRGDALVNSKAAFRAIAAGAGVTTAPGAVATSQEQARQEISGLLDAGHSVIVKQAFHGGGFGNEILTRAGELIPAGAPRVVVLPDRPAIDDYLTERWRWLTGGQSHPVVVERYFPGCRTIYAEFFVDDDSVDLIGVGEILMDPVAVGEIVPAQPLTAETRAGLVAAGWRLCESYRAIGYRGNLSADAVLTPTGDVVFTEANGRLTGSTHLHTVIAGRIVGAAHRDDRVVLERGGWPVPSFAATIERLTAAGLGYDPADRTGVLLTSDRSPADGTVTYCLVAKGLDAALDMRRRVMALFDGGRP